MTERITSFLVHISPVQAPTGRDFVRLRLLEERAGAQHLLDLDLTLEQFARVLTGALQTGVQARVQGGVAAVETITKINHRECACGVLRELQVMRHVHEDGVCEYFVQCPGCGARGLRQLKASEAWAAWNCGVAQEEGL